MSRSPLFAAVRSTDHDLTTAIGFLEEYAKNFYSHHISPANHHGRNFVPRFDLEEHRDTYELYGELPGFHMDNLHIEVIDERGLTISGSLKRPLHGAAPSTITTNTNENGESSALTPGDDANDPFVKIQQHHHADALASTSPPRHGPSVTPFADVLNPNRPLPPHFPQHEPDTTTATTTTTASIPATATTADGTPVPIPTPIPVTHPARNIAPLVPPKPPQAEREHIRHFLAERRTGNFHRAFHFPSPILRDEVTARMDNGILHLTARRAPMPPPVRVAIRRGSSTSGI